MLLPRARKRQQQRRRPFPDEWQRVLRSTPLYRRLPLSDRTELHGHVHVLLAEKRFEGAAGLTVSNTMRVLVAGQAAILLLHRPPTYFPKLFSVVIYPETYAVQEDVLDDTGVVETVDELRAGESWTSGAIVLSWTDVEHGLTSTERNVILHEFAHQLDAEDGAMNGAPILANTSLRERWASEMSTAYAQLIAAVGRGHRPFLDPYGTQDPAEFFAVATETFFLNPLRLQQQHPALYATLSAYYQQNPAHW